MTTTLQTAAKPPRPGTKIPGMADRRDPPLRAVPAGFHWPSPQHAAKEVFECFGTRFYELLMQKGLAPMQVATGIFGGVHGKTAPKPRYPGAVREWLRGTGLPSPRTAVLVARFFDVPLPSLLTPSGPRPSAKDVERLFRARLGSGGWKKGENPARTGGLGHGNGHANGNGHAGAFVMAPEPKRSHKRAPLIPQRLAPARPLPKGAKRATISFKTNAHDHHFADIQIAGTVSMEEAQTLIALLNPPEPLPAEPAELAG